MKLKNTLYFDSTRINTLAVLDAFNNVKHWVQDEDDDGNVIDVEKIIPIKFGNYEKSIALQDIKNTDLTSGNLNFIPRMILSFNGMSRDSSRVTNKYTKISKLISNEFGEEKISFGFNSSPYEFQYTLTLQARGLNEATTIVEQILPLFRPSYPISIQEYPIFDDMTETVLQISDPSFEIMDEFDDVSVNIINVNFDLILRGNIYMPLELSGRIEKIIMTNYLWDTQEIKNAEKASYYEWTTKSEN